MPMDRSEFLRGGMAAGAAWFAHSITGEKASALSATSLALEHVQRLVDAASDRLRGALADASVTDPDVTTALERIKGRAEAVAAQVERALPSVTRRPRMAEAPHR